MTSAVEELQGRLKTTLFVSMRRKKDNKLETCSLERKVDRKKSDDNYFTLRRQRWGSDPRLQTCRGKLQNRRSKLNQEINKELMLRTGAENLFNATNNKRMKEQVSLELQFVNSNLQLLKEQLAELNSSVEVYQGKGSKGSIPMIPLGLKETKEINFREPFKDFILEHYSEDADKYDEAITEFMDLRGAMRTPERDESGVALLLEYFNQLYFIDRRFFPPDRSLGIYFEWFDSLTGTPSCQRTVAFEKACVLFNLGALYTQLGARHDRTSAAGLDAAANNFLRAAGMFRYLHDTFTNAPSKDLSPEILEMLIHLMLAQARECLHEKALLGHSEDLETVVELAQEAAQVTEEYSQVFKTISGAQVKDCVPVSWVSMVRIKVEYYRACSHYHMAESLLTLPTGEKDEEQLTQRVRQSLQYVHLTPSSNTTLDITVPTSHQERVLLGLAHCRESVMVHEEALRQQRMCRDLKKKSGLSEVLRFGHESAVHLLDLYEDEEDLHNVLDPPPVAPATKFQLTLTTPDFSQHRVEDMFRLLGPVAVFSAKHQWSAPRPVALTRTPTQGFGFSVRGDAPVVIAGVDRGSLAERAGMSEGDLVVCIGTRDVKWLPHDEVVSLIREAGNSLALTLVTPCDKTYYKLPKSKSLKDISPHSTTSSSSGVSSSNSSNSSTSSHYGSVNSSTLSAKNHDKHNSWNPFKRSTSRDKYKSDSMLDNVILR
ncbi:rhophilin-2-B-like isoform X1 [Eriocheir sinensis]|uniref:rhophilin-2-B-like isoform X1 n=1 Tax=Eriocheir sinensis TaxID=95602 RepID=UPI0021C7AB64|nr:rhophilin-2-B-like isoform X1 [Eriocheir sinensis]